MKIRTLLEGNNVITSAEELIETIQTVCPTNFKNRVELVRNMDFRGYASWTTGRTKPRTPKVANIKYVAGFLGKFDSRWSDFPNRAYSTFALSDTSSAPAVGGNAFIVIPADNVARFGVSGGYDFNYSSSWKYFKDRSDHLFNGYVDTAIDVLKSIILRLGLGTDWSGTIEQLIQLIKDNYRDADMEEIISLDSYNNIDEWCRQFYDAVDPKKNKFESVSATGLANFNDDAREVWFEGDYIAIAQHLHNDLWERVVERIQ